ncbi:MAG: cyclic nucleotide-binding domain-containing protein [Spirulinaceae cyanobacterium RM2_2_10]|nr:cyclic nucleotide-binding domain-containing protein [Spirulinaceae cyanobacterium RM2_2_10]
MTGLLAFFNGRRTVNNLTATLTHKVALHVQDNLQASLEEARMVNRINADALPRDSFAIETSTDLEKQIWSQIEAFPTLASIYVGNAQSELVSATRSQSGEIATIGIAGPITDNQFQTFTTDAQGDRQELVSATPDYDPRQRPWYQDAIAAGSPVWGSIYVWLAPYPNLALPAVQPATSELLAVVGADISLLAVGDFLSSLQVGRSGQVFIIERDGLLIATSTTETPYSGQFERIDASESSNPLTRATARAVLREYGNFAAVEQEERFNFRHRLRNHVVQVYPFRDGRGLDWLIVVAIPQSDFTGTVNMQARTTLLLGAIAVGIATALGLLAARRTLQPLVRLNTAAVALKAQQFEPQAIADLTERQDEVGEFARVFQAMAATIGRRTQSLDEQLRALNLEVSRAQWRDRNAELIRLKPHQKQIATIRQINRLQIDLKTLLERSVFFCNFTPREMARLIAKGYQRNYSPDDVICREDEPGDEFYIILTGRVEILVEKLGKHLNTFDAGAAFGELSLLLGIPRTATAIARNYTTLFILARNDLSEILQQHPQLRDRLAQQLYIHQAELEERREILNRYNLLDEDFQHRLLFWIQRRLETLFGGT